MTNMNPLRDNELAAQERVIQLERELAERDRLIYKLQNPEPKKPKQPREPINWPAWFKKTAKISALTIGGIAFAVFCIALFECNETYVTKGKITKVLGKANKFTGECPLVSDKSGRVSKPMWCASQTISETGYGIEVEFTVKNEKRTARFEAFELNLGHWGGWPGTATKPIDEIYRVKFGSAVPYAGCTVNVYYALGVVFKDSTWGPRYLVDASMCKEPGTEESKKAEEPPRNADDNRRPNHRIE